jgi:drug/metabolite transporter (DMT)-like permease
MWFLLSLLALSMLIARRSAEKNVAGNVSTLALAWLQQTAALPFIIAVLFFAKFYWPSELSADFWWTMTAYVVLMSLDVYFYFKALSIADVSYVAPLMTLVAIGNVVGAYFVLGQVPTIYGAAGAVLIVIGGVLTYSAKRKDDANRRANKLALLLILMIVAMRSFASAVEVNMLRESNPTTFNFYSSILSVPLILIASTLIIKTNRTGKYKDYWKRLKTDMGTYRWLLTFIGLTYTVNMLATYQAKLIGPNAGYVGAIKSASVLPIMLIGIFLFKEKIIKPQWIGLGFIAVGLVLLAFNQ